ncbi:MULTISPECIES: M15 family metallopeptidase [unclassified Flavobacterium]|uniref:M15 family metallopeptidase n=1 Tax=unclassified Flavobacterium TaxID=196869 RepID=UPI001F12A106|nr:MULTISPECIES: M15 family metallopeptidase [unclassified Flavobacterium]UMY64633.1 M15 family metallopeptidase [Flavobacterium sp. HJ-32-4]
MFHWLALLLALCQNPTTPVPVQRLIDAYPESIVGYKDNQLLFRDGTTLMYDDGKKKTAEECLDHPDIEDMFRYAYPIDGKTRNDAGRIRNDAFFRTLYGDSKAEVERQLVTIDWCPKLVGARIRVTKAQGVDQAFRRLSAELDRHPEFKPYLIGIAGTFNWRPIAGTRRLSAHSFGMTIDLSVAYSHYWQWECKCQDEKRVPPYRNKIPLALVAIFEKHGFIWGGRWTHFDTMHFEYRPELLSRN